MTYEFTLVLQATAVSERQADELFEVGCDDATVLTRDNQAFVQFDRESPSLELALTSAIDDVERAGFAVARVEIERSEIPQSA